MPAYTYLLANMLTRRVLASPVLDSPSFSLPLGLGGQFSGSVALDTVPSVSDLFAGLVPGDCALYVERLPDLVAGAVTPASIVWCGTVGPSSGVGTVQITANQFDAYLKARHLLAGYSATAREAGTVVADWLAYAQGLAGGNIGLVLDATETFGPQTLVYLPSDQKAITDAIYELGSHAGFETAFVGRRDPVDGLPRPYLVLRKARNALTRVAFVKGPDGSNVIDYTPAEVMPSTVVVGQSSGSTTGTGNEGTLTSTAVDPQVAAGKRVRWEKTATYDLAVDQASTDRLAAADLAASSSTSGVWTLNVNGDSDPQFAVDYLEGAWVALHVEDQRHPDGADVTGRITQLDVKPPAAGQPREKVTISFDTGAPVS